MPAPSPSASLRLVAPHARRSTPSRLTERLTGVIERCRGEGRGTHALFAIDIDGFTRIRASFGVAASSRLLEAVGRRLRDCLSRHDEVALVAGDEFAVLARHGGTEVEARRLAERLVQQFIAPFTIDDRQVALTACIGVALVRPHHACAADVTRDAYEAMHRAKSVGSARFALFDVGMHEATVERLRLAAELRHAVERGEFRLHFQPIVQCGTGALAALEALIRWEHPERGLLAPAAFLGALGEAGLMLEVGYWVVGEACRRAVEWREAGVLHVPVSINVSPAQLNDPVFVASVMSILHATGAGVDHVAFEVTEDAELGTGDAALATLRELRAAGFRIRIDDFGTGYSALSYLQRLPVHGLKLDRAFIHELAQDERRRHVVASLIGLAHTLGLDVVAEGVERVEQLEWLRAMGCDLVQGFLFSRPMDEEDARRWLRSR